MSPFSEDVPVKPPFLKVVRSGKIASISGNDGLETAVTNYNHLE